MNVYIYVFTTFYRVVCTFYIENDAEIFPAHYTWKLSKKGFKMAFMMNKLAIHLKLFLKKKIFFCQIQVHTILVCTLCSIKYGIYVYTYVYIRVKSIECFAIHKLQKM
jgi:hypothetical protein